MAQKLNFGVLMLPGFQWLDAVGPVDYLNNHSQKMMTALHVPQSLVDRCPIINWHWISFDITPVEATSGPPQHPTCTYATAPPLDYLLIPGPDPAAPLPEGCAEYLRKNFDDPNFKALLTVCTGSMAIASTGLLDGLNVCTNKMALSMFAKAKQVNTKVKWVGNRRWIVDGKVWSGAGITAGIDLAAEFARVHFDAEAVEFVKLVSEYTPRPDQPDEFAKILEGVEL